jgi:glycerol-3-phosphate dehydrogenase
VNQGALVGGLEERLCRTGNLHLHGWRQPAGPWHHLQFFGADSNAVRALADDRPELAAPLHAGLPYTGAEVLWAARHEMARTVEDVLARRTRMLLLDARASVEAAPLAARLLAAELGRDEAWQRDQLEAFRRLAKDYLLGPGVT